MFKKFFDKNDSTVRIFDNFIASKEEEMELRNVCRFYTFEPSYISCYLRLYIAAPGYLRKNYVSQSNITMSALKELKRTDINFNSIKSIETYKYHEVPKIPTTIFHFLLENKQLFVNTMNDMITNNLEISKKILFPTSIELNAQSSANRTGYGNIYYFDELVEEGTLYGETSSFAITGFKLSCSA